MIDISNLAEDEVLAALYNASRPLGLGFLQFDPKPMTREQAAELLLQTRDFDYLFGRVMKVHFFDARREQGDRNKPGHLHGVWLYDRDNGEGAAERALAPLRSRAV